jgi:hypothetical protein
VLTENRLNIEMGVMDENFPQLELFQDGDKIGFQGWLRLTGHRPYQIVVEGLISKYPQEEPLVYLDPRPENHHWIPLNIPLEQRHLCYQREEHPWQPARSTFASCVAVAIKYLKEFGR